MNENRELLRVSGLSAGYGRMTVVSDVSFQVRQGEILAIFGRNGAGKTTSMLAVAGQRFGRSGGQVFLNGNDVSSSSAAAIVAAGLALVPEGHRIFKDLSVRENLELGAAAMSRGERRGTLQEGLRRVYELFPILDGFAGRSAGLLSGGQQQMVAVGQALMGNPRVLILDEPTSGIAPALSEQIYAAASRLKAVGLGIVVVEQNVSRALRYADRFYLMDRGHLVLEGDAHDPRAFTGIEGIILGTSKQAPTAVRHAGEVQTERSSR